MSVTYILHSMLIRKGVKFQLGQGVRMLLHYTNTKYEDTVYSIKNVNEWQAAKANNAWDLDFPNLPYYIDGNVKLTQSNAILRHIGRQHSLYGSNDDQSSEIDHSLLRLFDRDTIYSQGDLSSWHLVNKSSCNSDNTKITKLIISFRIPYTRSSRSDID